jgi:hypothetical protein
MDSTMEPRRIGRSILDVVVASPLFVTSPLWRRWHQRWGATDEEVRGPMPGDDLLAKPSFNATRAVTIKAPPDRVWPWIVQVGYDRAGFYSYDLFDHGARPSARRIVPEFQQLKVGDWVAMYSKVNDATAFRVRAFVPPAWLLWTKPDSTWAWKLLPLDGGRATRLVTRLKAMYQWRSPSSALLSLVLLEVGDFPMMRRMLRGLQQRAEQAAAIQSAGASKDAADA